MANEIITIAGMVNFFKEDTNTITKGELKYKADFVLDLRLTGLTVVSKVRASMKDKSYSVTLTIDGDGGILMGNCECPRGNWICSHMAATAIYVNKKGMSKTDLPNTWLAKPKKVAKLGTKTLAEFFPHPKPGYKACSREITTEDRDYFCEKLTAASKSGDCLPLQWILGPEPSHSVSNLAPYLIEDIMEDFITDKCIFIEKATVTKEQISWLARATVEQRKSALWGQFRKLRLTGSNFGEVIAACLRKEQSKKPFPPSLFKRLRGEYSIGSKDSVLWGQMHEASAIAKYQEITGNHVQPIGLVLLPCGFLGSSPDGIIFDMSQEGAATQGVLEIKCPWSHRNSSINQMVAEELKGKDKKKSFFLTATKELNKEHNYWHQVQAEILAANVTWAHFVIWTTVDCAILRIEKDLAWEAKYVPMLKEFYLNDLIPTCFLKEDE